MSEYEYEVALSFAGEQRPYVEEVARALHSRNISVFYDENEQVELWGKGLAEYFTDVFENRARMAVMFISEQYVNKVWTNLERRAMLSRTARESREYILPVRFDDTLVPGLTQDIKYENACRFSPGELAAHIALKIGVKPFDVKASDVPPPRMTSFVGAVVFDYSNYNGRYVIGRGTLEFETKWSKSSDTSIIVYNDPKSIHGIALGDRAWTEIRQIENADSLNYTSRTRRPKIGQIVLLKNNHGFFAAIQILDIKDDSRNDDRDELRFRYVIQPDGTGNFATIGRWEE